MPQCGLKIGFVSIAILLIIAFLGGIIVDKMNRQVEIRSPNASPLNHSAIGPYSAIVFIDGSKVIAKDANGTVISSGVAGTDDTTVIKATIGESSKVFIKKGTYSISPITLPIDCYLIGESSQGTILKLKNDIDDSPIKTSNSNDIKIENIMIDGNAANNTAGSCIDIGPGAVDIILRDVRLTNAKIYGANIDSSNGITLDRCYIDYNFGGGIYINNGHLILIHNSIIELNKVFGIKTENTLSTIISIVDCWFESNANWVQTNQIYINTYQVVVERCRFNADFLGEPLIFLDKASYGCVIQDNFFENVASGYQSIADYGGKNQFLRNMLF